MKYILNIPLVSVFLLVTSLFLQFCNIDNVQMESPGGQTKAEVFLTEGIPSIRLVFNGEEVIRDLKLQIESEDYNLLEDIQIEDIKKSEVDESWNTVNGKNRTVRNHYNQYQIYLKNSNETTIVLETRIYNKGFAYCFLLSEGIEKATDKTVINFSADYTFWAYNGENHNIGPVKLSVYTAEEVRNPLVFQTSANYYFAIHEAAIFEHAPFELENMKNNSLLLKQEILKPSNPGTLKHSNNETLKPSNPETLKSSNAETLKQSNTETLKHSNPETPLNNLITSWRAFIFGENPGDLIESNLLVNLNEPCKIEDTSWIKPGKSMWDWRVWGYKAADGFEYGLNTVSHKRFIDFAFENNIQYLLIDADWYGPEFSQDSDPTNAREGVNIEECMAYAKEKGVGVILYLNDVGAKKFGLERVLKQFADWGAAGVKYGFMRGNPQEKVLHTRRIVELCAKYRLMVDFHDNPVAPSGDRRTWPNLISKEFCHAQADAKRSHYPETIVTFPFVNMIAGPLDMTNGWFALNSAFTSGRPKVFAEIPGTVAAEVAKLIVIYSGLSVLPDAPEEYLKKDDLFDCIRQMPAQFDSYKVLDGKIGKYISVARRAGDNWFVGSLTNRDERELSIKLDFLKDNLEYTATLYEDAPDTHFENNKEAYQVSRDIPVKKGAVIKAKLAPGGGHSIMIRKRLL